MPRLVVEKGNDKGKTFVVTPTGTLIVGRDQAASAQLRDTMCSRQHFRIEQRPEGWFVVDLGSMNGTLLNGKPIGKEQKLTFGDLVKIGETLFSFLSDETAAEDTLVGQRMGGYKVIERVGRGGMGTVYKAEQIDLQRIVALKVIAAEHVKNKDFIEMFVHEARAAAKLNHTNIVQVYDVKKQNEVYYFSMEFVPGGSVQELLNKQRKIPVDQSVQMILDSARGFEYAHKKEIIHRDVKPDNLMISESGSIKIGDLGLAQRLGEKLSADDENSVIGTPHYIAPEQVLGRPADYRSDIYALGSTLYRMIAGFTPYQAPSVRELVNKKVREDAIPLHEAVAGLPKRLGEICAKMMSRKPEERYQTMTDVLKDLEQFQRESTGQLAREATAGVETLANKKLLMAAVGLLIAVVVVGGVGAVWLINRKPQTNGSGGGGGAVTDTGDRKADSERALDIAKSFEVQRMDPNRPDDIQKAIKEFQAVIDRFPEMDAAKEGQKHVDELSRKLRETKAQLAFAEVEKVDRENWRTMYQRFQSGTHDLSSIDETISTYQRFGSGEETKLTSAGQEADRRAGFIFGWKSRVRDMQTDFDRVRQAAASKRDEERYNESWVMLDEFAQRAMGKKNDCWFASDRYTTLLYEEAARAEQKKVMQAADVSFFKIEERVQASEKGQRFDEAIKLLSPVIESFPDEYRLRAMARRNALSEAWTRHRTEEAERAAREAEAAAAADAEEFEKLSRDVRKDVLAFDYKTAANRLATVGAGAAKFPRTERYRERVKARSAEMAALVELKETLKRALNSTSSKDFPGFKRESPFPGASGTIKSMDDREFSIDVDGSGKLQLALKDVKPQALYKYFRGAMKWTDARTLCLFAVYECELGLYEDALAGIATVMGGAPSKDKWCEAFCETYKPLLEAGAYTEADEIEADKRFARAKLFIQEAQLDAARREIMLLKTKYKATRFVVEKKAEIEQQLEEILRKGGDEMKKKERSELHKRILDHQRQGRADAQRSQPDLLTRLGRIPDPIQYGSRMGEFFAAHADWSRATDKLAGAKTSVDQILSNRGQARDYVLVAAAIYAQIYRGLIIGNKKQNAAEIRQEAITRFSSPDIVGMCPWWPDLVGRLDKWEARFREPRDMGALERALKETPENPQRLWDMVDACIVTRNFLDGRGYLRAMIEMFPDAPQVKTGEAQYQLAEMLLAFHDLKAAAVLYREIETKFREHPKFKDDRTEDSWAKRQKTCFDLMNKMGFEQDGDKK